MNFDNFALCHCGEKKKVGFLCLECPHSGEGGKAQFFCSQKHVEDHAKWDSGHTFYYYMKDQVVICYECGSKKDNDAEMPDSEKYH